MPENPKPGIDGTTTSKASRISPVVSSGAGERTDQIEELDDRAGPAVGQQQRQGVRLRRPHMDEMHVLLVDLRRELRQLVEPRFLSTPVVARAPVLGEPTQIADGNAVAPVGVGRLIRPAGVLQPAGEVIQVGFWDIDLEGMNGVRRVHLFPVRVRPDLAVLTAMA